MSTRSGRGWILAGLLAVTAGAASFAGSAVAQGHAIHGKHGAMGIMAPAATDAHFDKMLGHILPDGTPEQKTRLKPLAAAVHADLGSLHAQFGKTHRRAHDLLLQPVVDRAGLEALRAEQVRQVDVVSRRVTKALADAAEVLTLEQRARLAAHLKAAN